jgi:hypothetical protein
VKDRFARFDVNVVDTEPRSGDWVEAVVGGTPDELGLPGAVAGIAPMDATGCSVLPKAVVFVFAGNLPRAAEASCEVAAQEIAHAYGLDHEWLCEDPMSYLRGCGAKTFQNVDATCGEWNLRDCICGRETQNSAQILADVLGTQPGVDVGPARSDDAPPTIEVLSPAEDATIDGDGKVEIVVAALDDVSVSDVKLVWEENDVDLPCPLHGENARCERIGTTYAWRLQVGHGPRSFHVVATDQTGKTTTSPSRRIMLTGTSTATAAAY